jgi:hypothetical protein
MRTKRQVALGLIYRPGETPNARQSFGRAMVIRHARGAGLTLVGIYELGDDGRRNAEVLEQLASLAVTVGAQALVTNSVRPALLTRLLAELGLQHEPVPARWERRRARA